jgi:hypothetical protein
MNLNVWDQARTKIIKLRKEVTDKIRKGFF